MGSIVVIFSGIVCIYIGARYLLINKGVIEDKVNEGLSSIQLKKREKLGKFLGPLSLIIGILTVIVGTFALIVLGF